MYASIGYNLISFELWLLYAVSSGAEFYYEVSAGLCSMFLKMRLKKDMLDCNKFILQLFYWEAPPCFWAKSWNLAEVILVSGDVCCCSCEKVPEFGQVTSLCEGSVCTLPYSYIRLQQTNSLEGAVCFEHVPIHKALTFCSFWYQLSWYLGILISWS